MFPALIALLFCLLCACTPSAAEPPPTRTMLPRAAAPAETGSWRTATPESQGMDAQRLAALLETVQQERLNLHSLLIIRNGYLVSESYFGAYGPTTPHETYSCTKSVIATLIGIAIDQGQIAGVEEPLAALLPERSFAAPQLAQMPLEHVLTMRTGLEWQDTDPTFGAMYRSRDWVGFVLDRPVAQPPGTTFNYCSGCSHILSAVLQQNTGMNPRAYAEQYLFGPLGISNFSWESDPDGLPIGGWGLSLTPRDMAKLGYLYLQQGQWEGKQLVSSAWVAEATRKHTPSDGPLGYGYQWWTYPTGGAYAALGRYGQTIFVAPQQNLVVVTTAQLPNHDRIFELIETYVLPAVR
jgi:CubicO group peptidase (beta-lactamase class C family)